MVDCWDSLSIMFRVRSGPLHLIRVQAIASLSQKFEDVA